MIRSPLMNNATSHAFPLVSYTFLLCTLNFVPYMLSMYSFNQYHFIQKDGGREDYYKLNVAFERTFERNSVTCMTLSPSVYVTVF